MTTVPRWFPLALASLLLAGCAETSTVGERTPAPGGTATAVATTQSSSAADKKLAAQKLAAGIADCPISDVTIPALTDGLPDVTLGCLGGGRRVRLAGVRGRPMMLNVWAQWCGPCRTEAPYIAAVARENRSELMVLGVDYVDGVLPDRAIAFAQQSGWTYPQLTDPDKVLAAPLQIVGPPYTFFVRADGSIAGKHVGAFTSTDQIRRLAKQQLGVDL